MSLTDKILDFLIAKARNRDEVIGFLKDIKLDPKRPPAEFDAVYACALADYGVDKQNPILEFFRRKEIRAAFETAYIADDPAIRERETEWTFHRTPDLRRKLQDIGVGVAELNRAFDEFLDVFEQKIDLTLTPEEARRRREDRRSRLLLEQIRDAVIVPKAAPGRGFRLFGIAALPAHYQERPGELQPLKDAVLARGARKILVTGAPWKVGVFGMGGIGKTVMAAALARAPEMEEAFPDGIFWLTISREPNLLQLQSMLIKELGGDRETLENIQHGRARLGELLADMQCLLILDDVWEVPHLAAFDVLGDRCKIVVTTRKGEIVRAIGAEEQRIDLLGEDEALALLARWADQTVDSLPEDAHDAMDECGRLPLALSMVGAMVRGKPTRWAGVLERLRQADLEKIKQELPEYEHPNLLRAIQVSVDDLESAARERYHELAVFPEDTPIPEATLRTLWQHAGLAEPDAQDLIDLLVYRSLATVDDNSRLLLHDLQHDYVRKQVKDLGALHGRLLDAYSARCPDGWPAGPNDGYFFQHLPHHLVAAGKKEDLRELLFNFDWIWAKIEATNVSTLITDYDHLDDDEDLQMVRGAIRLAGAWAGDKQQLRTQLYGRLMAQDSKRLRTFIEGLPGGPWLRPLTPSLEPPGGPLLCSLRGHTAWVHAVSVTPDGKHAVSASSDQTLKVWNLESGALRHDLKGHTDWVLAVSVTPDGKHAVSASHDQTLKVWDLESGALRHDLKGHTAPVFTVSVTPDGKYAVSASYDQTLKVWDLESGALHHDLKNHTSYVNAVSVAPNGKHAVSASHDRTLKVWDLESGALRHDLKGHTEEVRAVSVTPDGQHAVSASSDQTLKVWDLESGALRHDLRGHTEEVRAVSVTPDHAVSASADQTLKVWDLKTGDVVATFLGDSAMYCCAVTPDSRTIVAGEASGRVHFLRLEGV